MSVPQPGEEMGGGEGIWEMRVTESEIRGGFHSSKLSRFLGKFYQLQDGTLNKISVGSKYL